MKILEVRKKDINLKEYIKRSALESDYNTLITEPTIVKDADTGKIICIFDILNLNTVELTNYIKSVEFIKGFRPRGLTSESAVFGFLPRIALRKDFCSSTTLAVKNKVAHKKVCDFALEIQKYYTKYNEEMFLKHKDLSAEKFKSDYKISDSIFTSGIINKNNPLKYHFDTGNLKEVYSAMLVLKGEDVSGGFLALPEYDLGFELPNNSLFLFDGQGVLHGVTPIKKNSPYSYRYSLVYYSMQQIWRCLTISEELLRIKKIKTERENNRIKENYNKDFLKKYAYKFK